MVRVGVKPPVEQGTHQRTQGTSSSMHCKCINVVIDPESLHKSGSAVIENASGEGNDEGTDARNVAAASRDGDKAGQDAIIESTNVVLVPAVQLNDENSETSGGCSTGGVHSDLSSQHSCGRRAHAQRGITGEAVQAKTKGS